MDVGDTQLIDSPPRSSSGESTRYDCPTYESTQLLHTQLFDQYEGPLNNAHKRQHLDLELETQLIEDHNFDDFRKNGGLILPSEDEASKDTQLIHGDEVHSGSSSGKDGEVDSALSHLRSAFSQKPAQWVTPFTHRDRTLEGAACRVSQVNSPFRDRYLGETQILSDDENAGAHDHPAKDQRNFASNRGGGVSKYPDLQNRDPDLPHFLRDFDPSRQDYPGQGTVGNWLEVTGQSEDRGWETAVRNLELVDSDASTDDDTEIHNSRDFNTDLSYTGQADLAHNANRRSPTRVSHLFCKQDLNKSPEPEFMMDEWKEENRTDLGIGMIDQGGSNIELLDVVQQIRQGCPPHSTPMETGVIEMLNGETTTAPIILRTAGSIRAASLHASALQASSCSSTGKFLHSLSPGSKSEEVQNHERHIINVKLPGDVPLKVVGTCGDATAVSGLSVEKGQSAVPFLSRLSDSTRNVACPRSDKDLEAVGAMEVVDLSKVGTSMQGESSSGLGPDVPKPAADTSPSTLSDPFFEEGDDLERRIRVSDDDQGEARSQPSFVRRIDPGNEIDVEPSPPAESHSSPARKSLERRASFGSGLFSGGSDMSYLSTQSPGDDSQARALNVVEKLVWLNATGLPRELQLEDEKSPPRAPSHAKSVLKSRIQVAEAKAGMDDPFGVFDWDDSPSEEAGTFFGGGTARGSATKGGSKSSIDLGQSKQSGTGNKKGGVVDVPGSRNKKVEKLPDKAKFGKPIINTDQHKGLLSISVSGGNDVKQDQHQGSRSGNGSGAGDGRQDFGCTEAASRDSTASHQERLGTATDKGFGLADKCLDKFRAITSSPAVEKLERVSNLKVASHSQRYDLVAGQSVGDTRLEHRKEATNASNDPFKALDVQNKAGERELDKHVSDFGEVHKGDGAPSVQSVSMLSPKEDHNFRTGVGAEAPIGNLHHLLRETIATDMMEEEGSLMQQDIGTSGFPHEVVVHNVLSTLESGFETIPKMPDKSCWLPLLQIDGNELAQTGEVHVEKSAAVNPEKSPQNGQALENLNNFVSLYQASDFQHHSNEDDVGQESPFERLENRQVPSKPSVNGTKLQLSIDFNAARVNGQLGQIYPDSVNVSTTDHLEGRDRLAKSLILDAKAGSDAAGVVIEKTVESLESNSGAEISKTDHLEGRDHLANSFILDANEGSDAAGVVIEKTVESLESNPSAEVSKVSPPEEGNESVAALSDSLSFRNDIKDEIQSAPPKATRRGRSQTRYGSKALDYHSGFRNNSMNREKGNGRRVTWAGPLVEDLRRRSIGLRSPQSSKPQVEVRDDFVVDSAAESSDQEEAEELKEEREVETASMRKISEAVETGSRYCDLDKIKRRFNMSDAAVARLLGTDEDEDPDLMNETTGVKVRSLRHIQPEADGNGDEITVPNFRRVSKGLRSVRSRSEEGFRRPWPFTSSDHGTSHGEEVVSPPDQSTMLACNMLGTVSGDCPPSDNELMTGRRRMRSIADVSFSHLPHATPGRPPLARGLRRKRARHVFISPPEAVTDPSDDDLPPPSISPLIGRFKGKGCPRSARKRKEPESDLMPSTSELSLSTSSSKETSPTSFKRRKRTGAISVLLSHGLNEDTAKQQKKILAKLGGRVTSSASECSHFVADKFVRTGNMLEAMASGKPVINTGWLETCSEANRFVDEEDYVLQDVKKEEEMGFSMISTLAAARQRPLFQGIKVYITPGTSPAPDSLSRIVTSAGGQVVHQYCGPAPDGEQESDFCVVISSEEEFEDCIPLLEQGAKVYTPELILSGVTSYHLDFANDQLFKNFATRRRRGSSSRRST